MRIPLAASMQTGRDTDFDQVLQDTLARDEAPAAPRDEAARTDDAAPAVVDAPVDGDDAARTAEPIENADRAETPVADDAAAPTTTTTATVSAADTVRRGDSPAQPEAATKGSDAPRSTRHAEPLFAAIVQHQANAAAPTGAVAPGRDTSVGAVGAAGRGTNPSFARGLDAAEQRANAALRAPQVAASYRTTSTASAELIEQTRDSVFKQILMQLHDGGGEMRVRLSPPDLGELDLKLVVESGNRLHLTIAADRQDTAHLLQRHLDELAQTLQQNGLEIAGASVQTRSEYARQQQREQEAGDAAHTPAADSDETQAPRRGGYVSATGLDFWA